MTIKATAKRVNVEYEARHKQPAFDLAHSLTPLLKKLYDGLSPGFGIRSSDLRVFGGSRVSDVSVHVNIPGRDWVVEISPEHVKGTFIGLPGVQELSVVKHCIQLAETAVTLTLGNLVRDSTAIAFHGWLACDSGVVGIHELIEKRAASGLQLREVGATEVEHALRVRIRNPSERWYSDFVVERSELEIAHVFVSVRAHYLADGRYNDLDARAKHINETTLTLLRQIGIEAGSTSDKVEE